METLFDAQTLRDAGINQALDHAGENWPERAYAFLLDYLRDHPTFMAEDVRTASHGVIQEPPSQRAWGGVIVRAARAGHIQRSGYRQVKNTKAHCTPAAVWVRRTK